jgi:Leucine-rich repeat (LRR) protein
LNSVTTNSVGAFPLDLEIAPGSESSRLATTTFVGLFQTNSSMLSTSIECLSFPNDNLHGTLEGENVIKLGKLATLDLGENNFSGNIPESIGQLNRLEELLLNNNKMYGGIPSTLSNCTSLITINLRSNNFSGELVNVNFSNLPNLKALDLLWNNFSGKIPETIYSCSNLTALRLSSNKFQGQLSKGLGNLKSLSFLSLSYNNLTNITNALQILRSSSSLTTLLIGRNFMNERILDDDNIDGFDNLQVLSQIACSLYMEKYLDGYQNSRVWRC